MFASQTTFSSISLKEKFCISIQILTKFVPKDPIYNRSSLVRLMAQHQTGVKPSPEPVITKHNAFPIALWGVLASL